MNADWFAGRLRELRQAAGLTQGELAERIGTTVRNVSRLETGVQEVTWPTVLALCEALGVTCLEFTRPPADQPEPRRGRPPSASEIEKPQPQRRRGRPRKEQVEEE